MACLERRYVLILAFLASLAGQIGCGHKAAVPNARASDPHVRRVATVGEQAEPNKHALYVVSQRSSRHEHSLAAYASPEVRHLELGPERNSSTPTIREPDLFPVLEKPDIAYQEFSPSAPVLPESTASRGSVYQPVEMPVQAPLAQTPPIESPAIAAAPATSLPAASAATESAPLAAQPVQPPAASEAVADAKPEDPGAMASLPYPSAAPAPAPAAPYVAAPPADQVWLPTDQPRQPPLAEQPVQDAAPIYTASASSVAANAEAARKAAEQAAMKPVAERASAIAERARSQAQRGMTFTARAELVQSLQLIAQALDMQHGTTRHSESLSAGLIALREAQDFSPPAGREPGAINVRQIALGHRTPVLKEAADVTSPIVAQQQYFSFAQKQLSAAVAGQPVASQALHTLGQIQLALAGQSADPAILSGPEAMVYFQAALDVDSRNHLAANELGVLLARYGQLEAARRALLHSVALQPHLEGWHNLSIVHKRLGEEDLAQRADHERQLLAQRQPSGAARTRPADMVRFVDSKTFAAAAGGETGWDPYLAPDAARTASGDGMPAPQRR